MGIIKIREASKNAVIGRQNPQRRKSTRGKCPEGGQLFKSSDGRQSVPGNRKRVSAPFCGRGDHEILTIEASGIGIACVVAEIFNVPVVFAKKTQTKNIAGDVYTTKVESFTHGRVYDIIVSKEFLGKGDKVLLIDDFLANGKALEGLATLVQDSGAELVGAGVVIEKGFQIGGKLLRDRGIHLESLAIVDGMDDKTGEITFRKQ